MHATELAVRGSATGLVRRLWDELLAAIALLTALPVTTAAKGRTGAAAFGLVGCALGSVAAVPLVVASERPFVAAALAIALLAVADRALHLDGLADVADGFAAIGRDAAERARSDPRVGAAGAAAIALVLLVDLTSLAALVESDVATGVWSLVVATAVSRGLAGASAPWVPTRTSGFGSWFGRGTSRAAAAVAAGSVLVLVFLVPLPGAKAAAVAALIAGAAVLALAVRQLGSVGGDDFGALIELSFATALAFQAVTP